MSEPIPVNHEVLRWARVSMGASLEDVANRLQKKVAEIEAWEQGDAFPTYVQLETLAYQIYKRPLALFFFPEPPEEESIGQSFRTLPEHELERIPPRMRYLLRKAQVLQLNLGELYEGLNPAHRNILRDFDFLPTVAADDMAEQVRDYLGIELKHQENWTGADEALKNWRNALEDHGVFVFKDSFNSPGRKRSEVSDNPFSGFCLYDTEFPLIYVNNNKTKTRQVFTLFHELAHLLMHTGGVDTRLEEYIEYLSGDNRRIEVLCNQFAGKFLMPSHDFEARASRITIDDQSISELADQYCVSREAILRRFLDRRQVSRGYYEEKRMQWLGEMKEISGSGGNHYLTKGAYLGERYVELVFSRYHQNRITLEQTAEYLGEKAKNVPGMEAWLFRQGSTT